MVQPTKERTTLNFTIRPGNCLLKDESSQHHHQELEHSVSKHEYFCGCSVMFKVLSMRHTKLMSLIKIWNYELFHFSFPSYFSGQGWVKYHTFTPIIP